VITEKDYCFHLRNIRVARSDKDGMAVCPLPWVCKEQNSCNSQHTSYKLHLDALDQMPSSNILISAKTVEHSCNQLYWRSFTSFTNVPK